MKIEELHAEWGRRVKRYRNARSQEEVAVAVGVDQATISRLERGVLAPGDALKFRLAGYFGARVDELFPYPAEVPPLPEEVA